MIVQQVLEVLDGKERAECTSSHGAGELCPIEDLRYIPLESSEEVVYAVVHYPLGLLLVATHESETCAVIVGPEAASLKDSLSELYPRARLRESPSKLGHAIELVRDLVCL